MSAVDRAAETAVERALDRLEAAVADAVMDGVAAERVAGGLRLTGRGLLRRRFMDLRLRDLVATAAQGAP